MNEQQGLSLASLLSELLTEARTQTALMQRIADNQVMLIEAMADDSEGPDAEPLTYMDGTPVR